MKSTVPTPGSSQPSADWKQPLVRLVDRLLNRLTASITTSIGMFQLPPVVVSTPLKILLFVIVDGWNLLANSLLKSF